MTVSNYLFIVWLSHLRIFASVVFCAFERKPERMMHLEASEVEELQAEPDFKKARQDMACLYRDARKNELK